MLMLIRFQADADIADSLRFDCASSFSLFRHVDYISPYADIIFAAIIDTDYFRCCFISIAISQPAALRRFAYAFMMLSPKPLPCATPAMRRALA
jgi:hypothetical protein